MAAAEIVYIAAFAVSAGIVFVAARTVAAGFVGRVVDSANFRFSAGHIRAVGLAFAVDKAHEIAFRAFVAPSSSEMACRGTCAFDSAVDFLAAVVVARIRIACKIDHA